MGFTNEAELRDYAKTNGIDLDELACDASKAIRNPSSIKVPITFEELTAMAEEDMAISYPNEVGVR